MKTVRVKSYAKVNFNLNVVGQADGFHLLDSVAASIDLFDAITLLPRRDRQVILRADRPELETPDNNAVRAAEAFSARFGTPGAEIRLRKGIPLAGGLGGSSADVAGVLSGMAKLYGVTDDLRPLAGELSSDGVFQLRGGYGRMRGKGDDVEFADTRAFCYIVLVMPEKGVRTADVFREYDRMSPPPSAAGDADKAWRALQAGEFGWLAENLGNALYEPAAALCPEIGEAYRDLLSLGPQGAVMSGSGSTVAGMFETKELVWWAVGKLRKKYKCVPAKLLPSPRNE